MCLGGGGGYMPPPVKKAPDPEPGPPSPPDMVNDQIIPNANPRDQQAAARGEFDRALQYGPQQFGLLRSGGPQIGAGQIQRQTTGPGGVLGGLACLLGSIALGTGINPLPFLGSN